MRFVDDRSYFGHPKGLFFLAFTEAWERFSFYGMTALLVLYMVNQLLLPGHVEHVAGFAGFRSALESVTGPLSTLGIASLIYGFYYSPARGFRRRLRETDGLWQGPGTFSRKGVRHDAHMEHFDSLPHDLLQQLVSIAAARSCYRVSRRG